MGIAILHHLKLICCSYQEDGHSVCCLAIEPDELQASLKQYHNIHWNPDSVGRDLASQVVFVGIYDGCAPHDPSRYTPSVRLMG